MAGTLKLLGVDSDLRTLYSVALGLTNNVKGVHFDGYYFWCADTTDIYQILLDGANARICRQFNVSGNLPGTTPQITGMCGNEHFLWVAYSHTVTQYEIAQISKDGNYLFRLPGFDVNSAAGTEWRDCCLYGEHFIAAQRDTGPAASDELFRVCDLQSGSIVYQRTSRFNYLAMTFDGQAIIGMQTNNKFVMGDFDNDTLFTPASTITGAEGMDILSRRNLGSRKQFDLPQAMGNIEGAHIIALVHN